MSGRGNRDHFVDFLGNALALMPAVRGSGLAPRTLRLVLAAATGKRRRLTLARPQRLLQPALQFLVFPAQPVAIFFQLPALPAQLLNFFQQLLILGARAAPLFLN